MYGLPSGATAVANGTYAFVCVRLPSVQGRLLASSLFPSTLSAIGIGWVGHVFTSSAVLCGTLTSGIGSSGLPVSRSRMNVIPYLFTNATPGRVHHLALDACTWPLNMTPLFGRSESHRSWWVVW